MEMAARLWAIALQAGCKSAALLPTMDPSGSPWLNSKVWNKHSNIKQASYEYFLIKRSYLLGKTSINIIFEIFNHSFHEKNTIPRFIDAGCRSLQ